MEYHSLLLVDLLEVVMSLKMLEAAADLSLHSQRILDWAVLVQSKQTAVL